MKPQEAECVAVPIPAINLQENYSSVEKKMRQDPFAPIRSGSKDLHTIIQVLKHRLPRSAHVYNSALMALEFPSMKGYTFQGDLSDNAIVVFIFCREDYGQEVNISPPSDFDYKLSDHVKEAFIATSIIDWKEKYVFAAIDRVISPMIVEISTIQKGNSTLTDPNFYYYMSQEEAAALKIRTEPGFEVKSLDFEKGGQYLVEGWKYTRQGTGEFMKLVIEKGLSSCLYLHGTPVSGLIANINGLLGMLYTGKNHRGKGYAITSTSFLLKQMGMKGLVPGSAVECNNVPSQKFHERVGMKFSHLCDYVYYEKIGFESKK